MSKKNKKASKKAPAKKKTAPKQGSSTGNGTPRSASRGGTVAVERYAKDPKSVAKRLKEKASKAATQAANAVIRAETAGIENDHVKKLQKAIGHFDAAKTALA